MATALVRGFQPGRRTERRGTGRQPELSSRFRRSGTFLRGALPGGGEPCAILGALAFHPPRPRTTSRSEGKKSGSASWTTVLCRRRRFLKRAHPSLSPLRKSGGERGAALRQCSRLQSASRALHLASVLESARKAAESYSAQVFRIKARGRPILRLRYLSLFLEDIMGGTGWQGKTVEKFFSKNENDCVGFVQDSALIAGRHRRSCLSRVRAAPEPEQTGVSAPRESLRIARAERDETNCSAFRVATQEAEAPDAPQSKLRDVEVAEHGDHSLCAQEAADAALDAFIGSASSKGWGDYAQIENFPERLHLAVDRGKP